VQFKGTPTNQSLFDAHVGKSGYHLHRKWQPTCSGPWATDVETGIWSGCRFAQWGESNYNFWVADANFSFLPVSEKLGAKHEFKMGFHQSRRMNRGIRPDNPKWGNYTAYFDDGVPTEIEFANNPVKPQYWDVVTSIYFMDQFRVGSQLTFNAGLRYERQNSYVPEQCRAAGQFPIFPEECAERIDVGTWNYFAPRVAMAWDVTGSGASVVKVGYGLFVPEESIAGDYSKFSQYEDVYRWSDPNGNGAYDPGEVDFDVNGPDYLSSGSPGLAVVNPDLELQRIQEFTVTYEQSITNTAAFRLMYLRRQWSNQITDANISRPYEAWTVMYTRRDPGPDGRLGTGDEGDGTPYTLYEYPAAFAGPEFERELTINRPSDRGNWNQAFEVAANKRGDIWSASGSFSATEVYSYLAAVPQDPNSEINSISDIWEWSAKFNGSVTLPYDINMGTIVNIRSALTGTRTYQFRASDPDGGPRFQELSRITVRMEEPGSQKENVVPTVNFRLSKRFDFGAEQRLNLSFDIINIANSSGIRSVRYASGSSFGVVRDIQPPRQFRFGASYSF
jgi:hypothetical protein